jgi:tyrosinase
MYATSKPFHPIAESLILTQGWVGGFMGRQDLAAFDPIFWYHHCFIDMVFDSWQTATGHKKWFESDPKKMIIAQGETEPQPSEHSTYSLKPFHKGPSDKDVYTSDDTQCASQLGYKYDKTLPSTRSSAVANHSQAKMVLSRTVNTQLSMTRAETAEFLPADRKTDNDLIINVRYDRFGIHNCEAYWIHFFVGQFGAPENYLTNPDRVGSVYNFTSPIDVTGCENCQQEKRTGGLATGQVPITGAMLKDWQNIHIQEFPSDGPFDEHSIETYLAERLHWKIITVRLRPLLYISLPLSFEPGGLATA